MSKPTQGHTLVETLIGFAVLGLLFAIMFFVYQMGANAWKKGESQSELLQQAQVVTASISHDVERSVFSSASVDPGPTAGSALGVLSSWNSAQNRYEFDPVAQSQIWQKYVVFYYDSVSKGVYRTEAPFSPSTSAVPLAGLASYRTGGRQLALEASRCEFVLADDILQFEITLERERYGSKDPEKISLSSVILFRN